MTHLKLLKNQVLSTEGVNQNCAFLIFKGTLNIDGYFFPASQLINSANLFSDTVSDHNATIESKDAEVFVINKNDLEAVLNPNFLEYLRDQVKIGAGQTLSLKDIKFGPELGKGNYSQVVKAYSCKGKYAIKCVAKSITKQMPVYPMLKNEKNILESLRHPFVVRLLKTFVTRKYLFFLMEMLNGLSFDKVYSRSATPEAFRFYVGCLLLLQNYLAERRIAHRDIKLENIMIVTSGYLKLIDFGSAQRIVGMSNTITGTAEYMAPEVILGKGYNCSCDIWSIGVVAYQIAYQEMPFCSLTDRPDEIYNNILKQCVNKQESEIAF